LLRGRGKSLLGLVEFALELVAFALELFNSFIGRVSFALGLFEFGLTLLDLLLGLGGSLREVCNLLREGFVRALEVCNLLLELVDSLRSPFEFPCGRVAHFLGGFFGSHALGGCGTSHIGFLLVLVSFQIGRVEFVLGPVVFDIGLVELLPEVFVLALGREEFFGSVLDFLEILHQLFVVVLELFVFGLDPGVFGREFVVGAPGLGKVALGLLLGLGGFLRDSDIFGLEVCIGALFLGEGGTSIGELPPEVFEFGLDPGVVGIGPEGLLLVPLLGLGDFRIGLVELLLNFCFLLLALLQTLLIFTILGTQGSRTYCHRKNTDSN
jgi:hypothetical protein